MTILETERLILRELKETDLDDLYAILSDPETMQFYPAPYDQDGTRQWITRSIESYNANGFGLWAVLLKEANNKFIGQCGLLMQHIDGTQVPEIGYHLNKNYWNNGYITEAAKACMQHGFDRLNMTRIYIHTYVKNIPSQRIAEKLGMQKIKSYPKYIKSHHITWEHVVYTMERPH